MTQQVLIRRCLNLLRSLLHVRVRQKPPTAPNACQRVTNQRQPSIPTFLIRLVFNDGKPVKTAKEWWEKRRPEIEELFDREVMDVFQKTPPKVRWEVVITSNDTVGKILVINAKKLIRSC